MTADRLDKFIHLRPGPEVCVNHRVILVHGLMRNSKSMRRLGKFLCQYGFDVYLYDYPSIDFSIAEHATTLLDEVAKILDDSENSISISFITHSLGGIISREMLTRLRHKNKFLIKKLIMLAPPNQGSKLARSVTKILPSATKKIKPMSELSSDSDAYVHSVSIPETYINCKHDFVQVNSTHTLQLLVLQHKFV